ncbi:DUF1800 domain-containing protein [Amphritea balenae]|uniref:DUF1800 domain-containing protein n=1 Tax=Amphritea balenae TaxID=452629 RepID=A0A3P1SRD2_9GAMM|nr:DUF1800 domain-containing protein [Amphritea balenae]RRC99718.1 DUF1800 domain-containing protein [Amphritea balenae]GGK79292.1 hypothetical protein GCM10007941_31900 [Amphritea balenae]
MQLRTIMLILSIFATPLALALDSVDTHHLLNRTVLNQITAFPEIYPLDSRNQAVSALMNSEELQVAPPGCVNKAPLPASVRKQMNADEKRTMRKQRRACRKVLQAWYAGSLLTSGASIQTKMVLFWHNHFTSSLKKVKEPKLIYRQHQLLEQYAMGNFSGFLQAMVHDSAMLIYLDNAANIKGRPNENLARELLELFSMGEGHYSEQDVKELARALTGLTVDREVYETAFRQGKHDVDLKTIFGQQGRYDAKSAVELILQHPATSKYITRKLWSYFISVEDETEIQRLSSVFAETWDIKQLVTGILSTDQFWADRGNMIKSPIELIVGTTSLVGNHLISPDDIVRLANGMGQGLFNPPNVKGWPTGHDWINADRLLRRINFSERVMQGSMAQYSETLPVACQEGGPLTYAALPPVQPIHSNQCIDQLEQLLIDPVWQLK